MNRKCIKNSTVLKIYAFCGAIGQLSGGSRALVGGNLKRFEILELFCSCTQKSPKFPKISNVGGGGIH